MHTHVVREFTVFYCFFAFEQQFIPWEITVCQTVFPTVIAIVDCYHNIILTLI